MSSADRLSTEEVALLREIAKWRRENGWTFGADSEACLLDWGKDGWWVRLDTIERPVVRIDAPSTRIGSFKPESVRQAVDLLVALELLPHRFSSSYAVGAASAAIQVVAEVGTAAAQREAGDDV